MHRLKSCEPRCIIAVYFLLISAALFARGVQEEEKRESINNEFILCITAFDVSGLPPGQQVIGSVLQKEFVLEFKSIHHRKRDGEEITRYEELAMTAAMSRAAGQLAVKRAERDALLFQGTVDWKYKKEIERIDKELRELEAAYKKAAEERPLIADRPLFTLSEQNTGNNFPLPPKKGGEEAFLKAAGVDAFLEGKFRIVYGRIYAEFRFYTRGASFIFEDSVIFSQEDLNTASDEIKSRFLTALVNSEPAHLLLAAEPDNARIEVNGRLVKSGDTIELPPGPVTILASADDHLSAVKEMELEGGDSQEIAFVLMPFTMETIDIDLAFPGLDRPAGYVYMGAQYLGGNNTAAAMPDDAEDIDEDPDETLAEIQPRFFSVHVPIGQYRYIRVETEDGLTGEAIVKGETGDEVRIIALQPRKLPGKDDKPVEDSRKKFYGAYGRFWIALPLAFLVNGFFNIYDYSYATSGTQEMFNGAKTSYYVSMGAWILAGVFLAESLVRMGIYVHTASSESVPLWK